MEIVFNINFFKRPRMVGIGIGYSYVPFDFIHSKGHANHLIEFHFIKWTMAIVWEAKPNAKL
jgi:hypothetical protein